MTRLSVPEATATLGLEVSCYGKPVQKPADGRIRLVWIGSKSTLGYLRVLSPILSWTLTTRMWVATAEYLPFSKIPRSTP